MTNDISLLNILLESISIPYSHKILNNPTQYNIEDVLNEVFEKIDEVTGSMNSNYSQIILYTLAANLKQCDLDVYNLFLYTLYEDDKEAIDEVNNEVDDILSYVK